MGYLKVIYVVAEVVGPRDTSLMPTFSILIDDGGFIASDPVARFVNIDEAVEATLKAAAEIAADRSWKLDTRQAFVCEVQDQTTRERRTLELSFAARGLVDAGPTSKIHPATAWRLQRGLSIADTTT